MATAQDEVLKANRTLLDSISSGDYKTYKSLCAEDLTCFEPETTGMLVQGISFHKYYFDLDKAISEAKNDGRLAPTFPKNNITMSNPHFRWFGDSAVVLSYVRVDQVLDDKMVPRTKTKSETRIWEKRNGEWLLVHVHKS